MASTNGVGPAATSGGRFLSGKPGDFDRYILAAEDYVGNAGEAAWLYRKPFDRRPGHAGFFEHMYNVLNLIRAMQIPNRGVVLEVGSGPGWLTEILMCLGYEVVGLEPCAPMIEVARERVAACIDHHRIADPPPIAFLEESLEECSLADSSVDAVIFHEALHHVVDEERGLAHCFRVLRPGGVLGVASEAAWLPGRSPELEAHCLAEMARYGTLENPYDPEYLDRLLLRIGFREVVRYHGINGFFPAALGGLTLAHAAQSPASTNNNLTACKPYSDDPTTADPGVFALGEVSVLSSRLDRSSSKAFLTLSLRNTGPATWLHRPGSDGRVTLGLTQGDPTSSSGCREAAQRFPLPSPLLPGEEALLDVEFPLSPPFSGPWHVEPICEGRYWFRSSGTLPAEVRF